MGLFFDILSSINHPEQRGNIEQLTAVTVQAEQLATQHHLDAPTLQALVTSLGRSMQSTLKTLPQVEPHGMGQIMKMGQISQWLPDQNPPVNSSQAASNQAILNQAASNQAVWTADRQKALVREIAQQTGVPISLVESMLPSLLSLILGLLNMGTIKSVAKVTNPLLNRFRDDQGNLGDVLRLSDRFLQGS
jgi:hypothetical protein